MKLVETNISVNYDNELCDHQSRVLEVPSWDEYCDLFRNYSGIAVGDKYNLPFNQMIGFVFPNKAIINNLKIDEFHLTCNMILWNGFRQYKLAYVIEK